MKQNNNKRNNNTKTEKNSQIKTQIQQILNAATMLLLLLLLLLPLWLCNSTQHIINNTHMHICMHTFRQIDSPTHVRGAHLI